MIPILQPMAGIHLNSGLIYELSSERDMMQLMDIRMVRIFFVIALFLLFLAAINYTNMAISHFNKRRKEMAMVKIMGSKAQQLFAGFFIESFVSALISLAIALVAIELAIGYINAFLNVDLSLNIAGDGYLLLIIIAVFLFTAVLSGLFPALYFVFTPPVKLLATRFNAGRKTLFLKKFLVGVQFSIAVFMIASAFVVYRQFDYMQDKDLGYDVENITAIELHARENKVRINMLDSLLKARTRVEKTARSNYIFSTYPIKHTILFENNQGEILVRSFNNIQTSDEYLQMMGITVFNQDDQSDSMPVLKGNGVLVNRALVDSLDLIKPIGKNIITHYQFLEGRHRRTRTISGVVNSFHYALLNKPVEPLVILPLPNEMARYMVVKFNISDKREQEKIIREVWSEFDAVNPLVFMHIEDNVKGFFNHNRNLSRFFGYFAWLCVVLSFLGVLGITAYNIEQRGVEIGIRKVMGASWYDFFLMFFSNYFWLYLAGSLAGTLVSRHLLNLWLHDFAFRVNPGWLPFTLAALLVGFTVFIAIIIHIVRIMYLNPADAIRKE
jgi:putative ABC transport system permease protein